MKKLTTLVAAAACLPLTALAQTERELDSHEHGAALLNVAIDGDELFIELESPWNNIVGFEHKPNTEEQHAAVDAAAKLLESPTELFALGGGNCTLTDSMIESGIDLAHSDHDEHGDEHDDRGDDHAGHDDEDTHSELIASYVFSCDSLAELSSIDVKFLTIWSGFESLDAQLIGPAGQSLQELSLGNTTLVLSDVQ